jgi:hypothetical protein
MSESLPLLLKERESPLPPRFVTAPHFRSQLAEPQ